MWTSIILKDSKNMQEEKKYGIIEEVAEIYKKPKPHTQISLQDHETKAKATSFKAGEFYYSSAIELSLYEHDLDGKDELPKKLCFNYIGLKEDQDNNDLDDLIENAAQFQGKTNSKNGATSRAKKAVNAVPAYNLILVSIRLGEETEKQAIQKFLLENSQYNNRYILFKFTKNNEQSFSIYNNGIPSDGQKLECRELEKLIFNEKPKEVSYREIPVPIFAEIYKNNFFKNEANNDNIVFAHTEGNEIQHPVIRITEVAKEEASHIINQALKLNGNKLYLAKKSAGCKIYLKEKIPDENELQDFKNTYIFCPSSNKKSSKKHNLFYVDQNGNRKKIKSNSDLSNIIKSKKINYEKPLQDQLNITVKKELWKIITSCDGHKNREEKGNDYVKIYMALENHGKKITDHAREFSKKNNLHDDLSKLRYLLNVANETCQRVQTFHDAGYVHRDLSPNNILVKDLSNGSIESNIIDFDATVSADNLGIAYAGTPGYVSPEVLSASTKHVYYLNDLEEAFTLQPGNYFYVHNENSISLYEKNMNGNYEELKIEEKDAIVLTNFFNSNKNKIRKQKQSLSKNIYYSSDKNAYEKMMNNSYLCIKTDQGVFLYFCDPLGQKSEINIDSERKEIDTLLNNNHDQLIENNQYFHKLFHQADSPLKNLVLNHRKSLPLSEVYYTEDRNDLRRVKNGCYIFLKNDENLELWTKSKNGFLAKITIPADQKNNVRSFINKNSIRKPLYELIDSSKAPLINGPIKKSGGIFKKIITIKKNQDIFSLGSVLKTIFDSIFSRNMSFSNKSIAVILKNDVYEYIKKMRSDNPSSRPEDMVNFFKTKLKEIDAIISKIEESNSAFQKITKEKNDPPLYIIINFINDLRVHQSPEQHVKCSEVFNSATDPSVIMAQNLLDLVNRRNELIKEQLEVENKAEQECLFRYYRNQIPIKQKKIDGIDYLIKQIISHLYLNSTTSLKSIVDNVIKKYPNIYQGRTKKTIDLILKRYEKPLKLNQSGFWSSLAKIPTIPAALPGSLGFKFKS